MKNLDRALAAQDSACFNPPWVDRDEDRFQEKVESIAEELINDAEYVFDEIENNNVLKACIKAMFKSFKNGDANSALVFAKSAFIEFDRQLNDFAEDKALYRA